MELWGKSLDEISAFPFENYLGWLKRLTRGTRSPIVQIAKRLSEWYGCNQKSNKGLVSKCDNDKNSWFQVGGGYFHIKEVRGDTVHGHIFRGTALKNFFKHFVESKIIGIVKIDAKKQGTYYKTRKADLMRKCVCIRYKDNHVVIPLLNDMVL